MKSIFAALAIPLLLLSVGDVPAKEPPEVIDTHVHLWHLDRPEGIYWIKKDNETLYRSFMPPDHEPLAEATGVTGVVVVQAGQHLPDNQWNLDVTAHNKALYRGVVGNLSKVIGSDEFKPLFDKLCRDERYVGYRLSGREGGQSMDDAFFRDLQITAARGKTVDILVGKYSLEDVVTIAKRAPDLKIILDHFGNIRLDGEPLDPEWVKAFRAAAAYPNVYCKVSALYGRVKKQPAPKAVAFYRPVLELALDAFGEDRLVFGSDWPVTRTSGDYGSVLKLTKGFFHAKGPVLCEKLFQTNAKRFYGLADQKVGASDAASAELQTSRPNVILMMADDLGYNDLSCYGGDRHRTPQLDKMAGEGLRLTGFYAGSAVCTPSRMALLTGAYPTRLGWPGGVLGYRIDWEDGLAPEALTIAEVFKGAGYATGMSGKWHLGDGEGLRPMEQGFDSVFYIKSSNNQTTKLWRGTDLVADPFDNRRLTEQFADEANRFIRAHRERPFFLYLPFTAPHFPAESHPDWQDKSANQAYGDVVEELDHRVGEILTAVKKEGLDRKTIVVFLSDNGPEKNQSKWSSPKPFRGRKWTSLEGGTRVPCIVRWPGMVPGGREHDGITAAIDLLPTLASACGIDLKAVSKASPKIDGVSVWGSWTGEADAVHARDELLYWSGWAELQAIRVGDWKLYLSEVREIKGSADGPVLINLKDDPAERTDLAAKHPERVKAMRARAEELAADIDANSLPLGGQ